MWAPQHEGMRGSRSNRMILLGIGDWLCLITTAAIVLAIFLVCWSRHSRRRDDGVLVVQADRASEEGNSYGSLDWHYHIKVVCSVALAMLSAPFIDGSDETGVTYDAHCLRWKVILLRASPGECTICAKTAPIENGPSLPVGAVPLAGLR